jgi:teichuronic acid biosynthesis glycosyltransferase TuaG
MDSKLVSVVMPVHNGEKTIRAAVESVFRQDHILELIVVDDCSTDGTQRVLDDFGDDERLISERSSKKLGAAGARNRGVLLARGKYVAFLDSDDEWADGKIARQVRMMEEHPYSLCCTGRELLRSDGTRTGRIIGVREKISYRQLLRHNCVNCSSVLLRRDTALRYPMEHEDSHEDYITWLRVLRDEGDAAGINEPLLLYRLSSTGKSGNKFKSARMTYMVYRYIGFGRAGALAHFLSYAVNGVFKYTKAALLSRAGTSRRRRTGVRK